MAQTPARPPAPAAAATSDRAGIDRAIAAVFPSLVRVSVVYLDQAGGREVKGGLSGSGAIISPDGFVVTNHHVAGRPRRIVCTLSTHEEVPADLVGTDPLADIAVIKLHPDKPRVFPAAKFGDSDKLARGQSVLAMGSPLALSQSVTLGIVSNLEMIMPQSSGSDLLDGEDVGSIVRWIGHDAAIYPGNSGGPLVNLSGEIVGVNEISFGLGGAIPSNLARTVVDALIKDGRVKRAWTGIDLQPRIGDAMSSGALVSWVVGTSPAATAGLKSGDLLMAVNDQKVDVRYAEQLPRVNQQLLALPVGQPAHLRVLRNGAETTLTLTPTERPPALAPTTEMRSWGVVVSNLTEGDARELMRDSIDGVRVVEPARRWPCRSGEAGPPAERHHHDGRWEAGQERRRARQRDAGRARRPAAQEAARRIRSRFGAPAHGRRGRHARGGRSAARGEEGLAAGGRAGADAAACRRPRPQGPHRRARDAPPRRHAAQDRRCRPRD